MPYVRPSSKFIAPLLHCLNPTRLLFSSLLCVALLLSPIDAALANTDKSEIRLGSVAMETPPMMHQRLLPLARYLSETLGRPVSLFLAPNMATAINDVTTGTVELAYLTPVAYIRAHRQGNSRLIAKMVTNGSDTMRLAVVVRKESLIQSITDLAGKRFAFGDRDAVLQRAVMATAGLRMETLGHYSFLDHQDNTIRSVLHGVNDAGILKETSAIRWLDKGIRVIYESPELPPYNITASPNVDDKLLAQLRNAFLKLDARNPEHYAVIKALDPSYTGFAAASDHDYDNVRKLIESYE